MKHTDDYYEFISKLFEAHDATTPSEYAREAYDRTQCGVWTSLVLADGSEIPSANLNESQDTLEWATRNVVGIRHGAIVEGSDAAFRAEPLILPFSDEELATVWQRLEEQADEAARIEEHSQD